MAEETKDPEIQVEVVAEPEAEKPRMRHGDTSRLDVSDDEISRYGQDVQSRIKKLKFAFHEERRMREQAQRDTTSATELAQRLYRENSELKRNVTRGEQAVIHQAMTRVDTEITQARDQLKTAHATGATDEFVAANEKLARAVAEKERLALIRDNQPAEESNGNGNGNGAPPPPQPPQQDERTRQWMQKNSWWNKPGEEERTAFAMGVHNNLASRGITAINNPEEYWGTIDKRLAAVFPDQNGNGNGNSAGDEPDEDDRDTKTSRPLAVAGGTRSAGSAGSNATRARVIRLSESQVRVAHRLGITPEQYAAQLAKEQASA